MQKEEFDNFEEFNRKDTEHKLPLGWLVLFIGLILWGAYYFVAYTPAISGWTQEKAYQESIEK